MDIPDLSKDFPYNDPSLKTKPDPDNQSHGPHYDVIQAISGGTDQTRVSPEGDVIGGTTNIGSAKLDW